MLVNTKAKVGVFSIAYKQLKQNNEAWLSLVERCVRDAEVAGSNPVASTNSLRIPWLRGSFFCVENEGM